MLESMFLEILTPEKKVFEGDVTIATFPGADGSFQIMDNHAPLISLLTEGVVEYKSKEATNNVTITGGVVEVLSNKIILLADGVK
jgi:F-type H+-transporting ATPase subunit epsilon